VFALTLTASAACPLAAQSPAPAQPEDGGIALAMGRARESNRPLLVLITERGKSRADDRARALLDSPATAAQGEDAVFLSLDLAVSRNRATAARFHVTNTPLLVSLSSRGIIIGRDEHKLTRALLLRRMEEARRQGPELDRSFAALEAAALTEPGNITAQFALTDFLLAHHNDLEAIPRLSAIAHSPACPPADRVRAWVALARAHLWIAEPEKGRHEADDLVATLGPVTPEAVAGGKLVLGLQDANARRIYLARRELEEAAAAAPESPYGKQAADALAKLPKGQGRQ
jgi:hypothetical protein